MPMYDLTSNSTKSFLKFDKNPSAATVHDSMVDPDVTWTKSNIYPLDPSLKKYKSRAYSMASTSQYADGGGTLSYIQTILPNSYLDRISIDPPPQGGSGSNKYYLNSYSCNSFSIDFWFYPMSKTDGSKFLNRPIFEIKRQASVAYYNPSADIVYVTDAMQVILSSYNETDPNKIGLYYALQSTPVTTSPVSSAGSFGITQKFEKIGTINIDQWNHLAVMRSWDGSSGGYSFGYNGNYYTQTNKSGKNGLMATAYVSIGSESSGSVYLTGNSDGVYYNKRYTSNPSYTTDTFNIGKETTIGTVLLDNVRLSNKVLYTGPYTPPDGLTGKQIIVYDDYAYYNEPSTGLITKLSFAKWSSISDADKLTLLDRVAYDDLPTVDQIKQVQTDPDKEVICYNYAPNSNKPSIDIQKIDESQSEIVYPTQLMDYSAIQANLVNIFASGSIASTSNIRLAVTRDFNTYYTYNMTNNAWVPLDNKYDVKTDGILLSALKDIPKAAWIQFDLSKFAFSISLTKTYEADACQIDDIKLKVNLDSKWVKSIKGTQSKYQYVGATLLKVTFLEDGKYKVNYNDRG